MKWITLNEAYKTYAVNQTISSDEIGGDAVADALVETKTAKIGTAPSAVTTATLSPDEVRSITDECVSAAIKRLAPQGQRFSDSPNMNVQSGKKEWATCRRFGKLKNFQNNEQGYQEAYRFGRWYLGMVGLSLPSYAHLASSVKWCNENGLSFQQDLSGKGSGQSEGNNQGGGFLVPIEFDSQIIDLREKYGIFRQYCMPTPMMSDTKSIPRRLNGLTSYFVGENVAGTSSTLGWDNVQLTAKKIMCIAYTSSELSEDAIINIGDTIAGEIAYSFALLEDQCGFVGTGTSQYGGITGVTQKIYNLNATKANILGLQVGGTTGNTGSFDNFTLANFNDTLGRLPQYAYQGGNARWYMSQAFWGQCAQRLATAAGGNKVEDIVNGVPQFKLLGFPVIISQVMPSTNALSTVYALFGDLAESTTFGDRRMTAIKVTDQGAGTFERDQLAIRGTERFDIVVHDVGQSTGDVPRDPLVGVQAGPIVALASTAS